ncbi:hypothetical protein B5M44_25500 [Shinella sumterensis]|nr:hypothetical protein B5M44_25500 [Shinella sumterensis]
MIARKDVVFPQELERLMRAALDRPDIVAFGTSSSIAELFGVSTTTVIRLAAHLGFANFRAMRELFRAYLRQTAASKRAPTDWQHQSHPCASTCSRCD